MIGTWNYRLVEYKDGSGWGVHEVYYDDKGEAWAMTENPVSFKAFPETFNDESPDTIISSLCRALADVLQHDIFKEPEKWPKECNPWAEENQRIYDEAESKISGDDKRSL